MKARMRLPPPPPCHTVQIVLEGAAYGWGDADEPPTVAGVDLELVKGQRLVLIGPNGAGKPYCSA
jgi:ABC-type Mn2+/Zn2+ transport system ATPase subunit